MHFRLIPTNCKETIKSIKTAMKLGVGQCHHKTYSGLLSFSHFQQALWYYVDTINIHVAPWASQENEKGKVLNCSLTSQERFRLLCAASRSLLALLCSERASSLQLCQKPLDGRRLSEDTVCGSRYLMQLLSKRPA